MKRFIYLLFALSCFLTEGWSQAVRSFQKEKERVVFKMADGELQLYPLSSNKIRKTTFGDVVAGMGLHQQRNGEIVYRKGG